MNFVIKERPATLIVFLLLWFLAGVVQGALMPLSGEEAYYLLEGETILKEGEVIQNLSIHANETLLDTVTVPSLSDKKRYHLRFGLKAEDLPPTINSNRLIIRTP
jgi:hypothetical protein